MLKQAGQFAAVGLEMGIAVALGIFVGWYLDEKLNTTPVLFWIGFALGIGAAGKAIWDAAKRARKEMMNDRTSSSKKD